MDHEKTYTMAEAIVELMRRACHENGHEPCNRVATISDPVGFFVCECGAMTWMPSFP